MSLRADFDVLAGNWDLSEILKIAGDVMKDKVQEILAVLVLDGDHQEAGRLIASALEEVFKDEAEALRSAPTLSELVAEMNQDIHRGL